MRQFIEERPLLQRLLNLGTILLVVGTLLLLATTLTNAEFRRGNGLFSLLDALRALFTQPSATEPLIFPQAFWDAFAAGFWLFFILSIGILIFSKDSRRTIFAGRNKLVPLFLLGSIVLLAIFSFYDRDGEEEETISGEAVDLVFDDFETAQLAERLEELAIELPDYPSAQAALAAVGIIVGVMALVLLVGWWQYRRDVRRLADLPVDELRLRAMQALLELRQGNAPLADVIRRCYREMVQTVHEQRGVYRERHITPREFEQRLLKSGFPHLPVQRLTRLFEQVRYGNSNAGEREKRQAIDSLEQIVAACEKLGTRRQLPRKELS
ncbi:DUF4129 domain-containing protein [Candidatus Leptofilum sp.]|uniref:DUF4129 domain-containing protein n=1 Tax=Candidatus Leptofilum sp. TaxID=3241576 RepID=UPI003B59DD5C